MRRQWFVCFILLWIFTIPVPIRGGSTDIIASVATPAKEADVPRVYGTDLAELIYSDVEIEIYREIVREISENGSRFITDSSETRLEENRQAREYIKQKLFGFSKGRIEVEEIGQYMNIVGKLPGYLPGNNPAFAISAHYDSPEASPGANCDGSGIAAVLTLAKVMSKFEWPLDIYFIAFNGLFGYRFMQGSPEVANEFEDRGIELLMLYNVDTILVPDLRRPSDERILMGYPIGDYHIGRYWAELSRMMSTNIGADLILPVPSLQFHFWYSSDHYAFFNNGFNAMCAFESGYEIDQAFHNGDDEWTHDQFSYNLGRETTAVIGASMAHIMGRTYGERTTLRYEFDLISQNYEIFYVPISTPTTLNITARWFGGSASFYLFDPSASLITSQIYNQSSAWELTDLFSPALSTLGLYTLVVFRNQDVPTGFEIEFSFDSDIDGNGVRDSQEFWIDGVLFNSDQDNDGLSDAEEIIYGTDELLADSDSDTMPDKFEVDNGLDPLDPSDANQDADGDHLTNAQEYSIGLNMFSTDTDSDTMDDLWELENGLDPLIDDSMLDADQDGITNLQEYLDGTDPQVPEAMEIPVTWVTTPVMILALIGALVYIQRTRNLGD